MSRQLLCPACALDFNLHPEDAARGMKIRKVNINAKKPHNHGVTIGNDQIKHWVPYDMLVCDHCNVQIKDGSPAVAVTLWEAPGEPDNWEKEYSQ